MTRLSERIRKNLKTARVAAGFSQERLAQESGVSASSIARIEQGRTTQPRSAELAKIASALGVNADDLMGLEDDAIDDLDEAAMPDTFRHELARRYGPENAAFVDVVARKIQEFPPREAAFVRNLLMGAIHGARSPWRNSPDGPSEVGDLTSTPAPPRTYQ